MDETRTGTRIEVAALFLSLGLTGFLVFIILTAAAEDWSITIRFNDYGEGWPEVTLVLSAFVLQFLAILRQAKRAGPSPKIATRIGLPLSQVHFTAIPDVSFHDTVEGKAASDGSGVGGHRDVAVFGLLDRPPAGTLVATRGAMSRRPGKFYDGPRLRELRRLR